MSVKATETPFLPLGEWKLEFEDYDSDTSVNSLVSLNDKMEEELNAIDGETNFKSIRALKMYSETKHIVKDIKFEEAYEIVQAQKVIKGNDYHLAFPEFFTDKRFISQLANSRVISLKLNSLNNESVKALSDVLKTNCSIKIVTAYRSEEVTDDYWDYFAESIENNFSLLFFVDTMKSQKIEEVNNCFSLDRVRRVAYRNQQLCETAFKTVENNGEAFSFRHCHISVVGGPKTGKTVKFILITIVF